MLTISGILSVNLFKISSDNYIVELPGLTSIKLFKTSLIVFSQPTGKAFSSWILRNSSLWLDFESLYCQLLNSSTDFSDVIFQVYSISSGISKGSANHFRFFLIDSISSNSNGSPSKLFETRSIGSSYPI